MEEINQHATPSADQTAQAVEELREAELIGDALDAASVKKSKKAKKKDLAAEDAPPAPQGLVLYTDGGCRPNPGYGGWGVHGYLFRDEPPKKGSGNPDHLLTHRGYMTKQAMAAGAAKQLREITPVHYVDGVGALAFGATNNVAEICATTAAIEYAIGWDIKTLLIITDSEHVLRGLSQWVDGWIRNGWLRADGSPIANVGYWQRLVEVRDLLRGRGVQIHIEWIKAHDDHLGNERADTLATIGVLTAQAGEIRQEMTSSVPEGYWKYETDKHPFFNLRYAYLNTSAQANTLGEYYCGNAGNEVDLMGKRVADGAFSLLRLERPDPVVELVRTKQVNIADHIDKLVLIRLEYLFQPHVHEMVTTYRDVVLRQPVRNRLDLSLLDEEPITKEIYPPKIAWRVVEKIAELSDQLDMFLAGNVNLVATDLTPILYETSVKTDKKGESTTTMKLKAEYNVGFATLPVEANYKSGENAAQASVTLTLGIDMLDRNSLKRLEEKNPKVTLITWQEAPDAFRYATVVEAAGDKGIWAGVYSNLRIVQ